MARKPALGVGANPRVRPKILQYFIILPTIWPKGELLDSRNSPSKAVGCGGFGV
jgi:hypothetical protein